MSIAAASDVQTYLGQASLNAQAQLAWNLAEQAICDFLHWKSVEQQTFTEIFTLDDTWTTCQDPPYIKASSNQAAIPGWWLAPNTITMRTGAVRSITSIYEDATARFGQAPGAFPATTLLTSGVDYFLKTEEPSLNGGQPISWSGEIERYGWWFPAIPGSIKVTYVAGFDAAELSTGRFLCFKRAVLETTADIYLRQMAVVGGQRPDISSEGLGGGASTSYRDPHNYGETLPDSACEALWQYVWMGTNSL